MAKKAEVAESVFEYLLCEILDLQPRPDELAGEEDQVSLRKQEQLHALAYRCTVHSADSTLFMFIILILL